MVGAAGQNTAWKGDAILRQVIREYLRTVDLVSSFKDEHIQLGGAGITVVKLDL
jgi:DNA mismatch repair protein MutS2